VRLRAWLRAPGARRSYAQCGEDLIVRHLLVNVFGRSRITYLDVGAHDPWFLSNTALFYRMGFRGVCVEADPALCANLARHRPRDTCLNVGVNPSGGEGQADFFVMSARTLSTFSRAEADHCVQLGHRVERIIQVPLLSLGEICRRHFAAPPDFLSIDVEGLDEAILREFDLTAVRPAVVCVETVQHATERRQWAKHDGILRLMAARGYFAYADTFINTIFVDREVW